MLESTTTDLRKIDLPDKALLLMLSYIGHFSFVRYQSLSRSWFCRLDLLFTRMSRPLETGFTQMYNEFLTVINRRLVFTPTEFGNSKGLRIDTLLEIQLKEDSPEVMHHAGQTLKLETIYRYMPGTAIANRLW